MICRYVDNHRLAGLIHDVITQKSDSWSGYSAKSKDQGNLADSYAPRESRPVVDAKEYHIHENRQSKRQAYASASGEKLYTKQPALIVPPMPQLPIPKFS